MLGEEIAVSVLVVCFQGHYLHSVIVRRGKFINDIMTHQRSVKTFVVISYVIIVINEIPAKGVVVVTIVVIVFAFRSGYFLLVGPTITCVNNSVGVNAGIENCNANNLLAFVSFSRV